MLAAAGHKAAPRPKAEQLPSNGGPELFVCGSASEATCEFAAAAKEKGTPLFSLPESVANGQDLGAGEADAIASRILDAFGSQRRVILNVGLPKATDKSVVPNFLIALGKVAEQVIRKTQVGHVYAEGGATAAELVRRMGWNRLKVLREEARGVVTLAPENAGSLLLTMKPGSYVWPAKWM
jgi:uncharacterized protein YgbK (DUF1537 family)